MPKLWTLALVAAVATACSDSIAPVERLTPDGLNPATVTLNGGTSTDIQNAVNSVSSSGGGTVILENAFHMTGPVGLKSNVTVKGGAGNLLYCTSGVNFFVRYAATTSLASAALENLNAALCTGSSFVSIYQSTGQSAATISNLRIEGNEIHGSAYDGFGEYGVRIASHPSANRQKFTGVVIRDNSIARLKKDAIHLAGRSGALDCCVNGPVDITENVILTIGTTGSTHIGFGIIVAHTTDIDILGNHVNTTCEEGIRITHSNEARIKFNRVAGVLDNTNCDASGIKSDASTNVVIQQDTILDHTAHPHIEVLGGSGVDIVNNYINAQATANYATRGIVAWPGPFNAVEDVLISGNKIYYVREAILLMPRVWSGGFTGLNVHYVDVINNFVRSTCTAVKAARFGTSAGYVRHLKVDGNNLGRLSSLSCPDHSVYLDGAGYVDITNNTYWKHKTQVYAWNVYEANNTIVNQ